MPPVAIADRQPASGGRGGGIVAVEPLVHVEDVALLRPQQACQRPPLHEPLVLRGLRWRDGCVEPLGLVLPRLDDKIDVVERADLRCGTQSKTERGRPTGRHVEYIVHRGLGANLRRIDRSSIAAADGTVEGVLRVRPSRLVVGEEELARSFRPGRRPVQPTESQSVIDRDRGVDRRARVVGPEAQAPPVIPADHDLRFRLPLAPPGPGVAKPERRDHMERSRVGPAIAGRDSDDDVLSVGLRILDVDVEIAVLIKDAGVDQLVLRPLPLPALVLRHEIRVGEGPLRILVEKMHGRVGRRVVDVKEVILQVLAVVPLQRVDAEKSLLEVIVGAVPERGGKAENLVAVTNAGDAILAPAVGPATGHVVGQIRPGVAIG